MSFFVILIALLVLSANGIIIPTSAWYCMNVWFVCCIISGIGETIKKKKED